MSAHTQNQAERRLYTIGEVARYARLHPSRVRSWFVPSRGRGTPVLLPESDAATLGLSFLDLIETCVVGMMRAEGVSMPVVRSAHAALKRELHTDHSFARREIYTDGEAIFVRAAEDLMDGPFTEILSRQAFFSQAMEPFLARVEYNKRTRLAERWEIAPGVVIDPTVGHGKPVVRSTGATTFVLASSYRANGGDADRVAHLFRVSPEDVLNAVEFEEQYGLPRVA